MKVITVKHLKKFWIHTVTINSSVYIYIITVCIQNSDVSTVVPFHKSGYKCFARSCPLLHIRSHVTHIHIGDTLLSVTFMSNVFISKGYMHSIICIHTEYSMTSLETSFPYQQLVLPLQYHTQYK